MRTILGNSTFGPLRVISSDRQTATLPLIPTSPYYTGSPIRGFGPTRQLLTVEPFRLAPWLTLEICEQELDIQRGKES